MKITLHLDLKDGRYPLGKSPDQGEAVLWGVLAQVSTAATAFASEEIDRKVPIKAADGTVCGELELLRF